MGILSGPRLGAGVLRCTFRMGGRSSSSQALTIGCERLGRLKAGAELGRREWPAEPEAAAAG